MFHHLLYLWASREGGLLPPAESPSLAHPNSYRLGEKGEPGPAQEGASSASAASPPHRFLSHFFFNPSEKAQTLLCMFLADP